MARVVKEAEVRKEELLDIALELFLAHGYERTAVEQITRQADVAKGTFYHYFGSKQDLLEQLVERFTDDLFTQIERALAEAGGTALERFQILVSSSSRAKLGRKDETLFLSRSLFSEGNAILRGRLREGWMARTRPIIRAIVEQGCAEGCFNVPDIDAMTGVWLSVWYDFGMDVAELFFAAQDDPSRVDELIAATDALVLAEERILGAQPGALDMNAGPALRELFAND